MSCYFRHLDEIFAAAGITPNKENKKHLDKLIHQLAGQNYKHCPLTWSEVQKLLADPLKKQEFVQKLKNQWKS